MHAGLETLAIVLTRQNGIEHITCAEPEYAEARHLVLQLKIDSNRAI